ncbi:GNAT family N-acetyltransferase [Phyllobacterium salinisoli]|nr:GNAT family N-acetyltransferase [Phyllobacterium salinisoli]
MRPDPGVEDNFTYSRYEMPIADGVIAVAYYRIEGEIVILVHTEVPFEYSGQGIGSLLAQGVFDAIRQSGHKVRPICPFMAKFAVRHSEYRDMVVW